MASVTLEKISKIYPGNIHAVRDLDLEIQDGEFLVLVGPSGCGKSTTLRMIAGLEAITSGKLHIGDRVVNDADPHDRNIAMVFQNFALYPHMTVEQNMSFALAMRNLAKDVIRERVAWAAKLLGLEDLLKRKPQALSGGQQQRVALGRAIVRKPAVFLFDEPLSNMDAKLRIELRAEIKRLHRQLNTTTVYVTHDQEEAMALGDRVVVMCDGVKCQCDAPLEIFRKPADRFVAGFMGMPPMNFFEGQLEEIDGQTWFSNVDFRLRLDKAPAEWLGNATRRPVVAGIRPECFRLEDPAHGEAASMVAAKVLYSEPLGNTMDVYLATTSGTRIVCRAPLQKLTEGQAISARIASEQIHLFEQPSQADNTGPPAHFGRNLRAQ